MAWRWRPTLYRTNDEQTVSPAPCELDALMERLNIYTLCLQTQPYSAANWLERAKVFLRLNFPELAAGDAYKASLLIDRGVVPLATGLKTDVSDVMGQALFDCHCHQEWYEHWERAHAVAPTDNTRRKVLNSKAFLEKKKEAAAAMGGTDDAIRDRIRDGGVLTIDYPWVSERHHSRDENLIRLVNQELNNTTKTPSCCLRRSTLATKVDMLGIFALQNFEPGDEILLDRTATAACSSAIAKSCENCFIPDLSPIQYAPCCSARYCSVYCRDVAMATYHGTLCHQDFGWLFEPAKGIQTNASPMRPLLMLRILATCIQASPYTSPLDHSLIARLTPLANVDHIDVFTLTESIKTPTRILEQLGIDVFKNQNFDTAILQTIWSRLANNKAGSPDPLLGFVDEISPFLPLFNHSCRPNVGWRRRDGCTTISIYAKRKIIKGEELFSSYLDVDRMNREQRIEALWPWFEGPCLCWLCKSDTTVD